VLGSAHEDPHTEARRERISQGHEHQQRKVHEEQQSGASAGAPEMTMPAGDRCGGDTPIDSHRQVDEQVAVPFDLAGLGHRGGDGELDSGKGEPGREHDQRDARSPNERRWPGIEARRSRHGHILRWIGELCFDDVTKRFAPGRSATGAGRAGQPIKPRRSVLGA
jgi:hypothetical protein